VVSINVILAFIGFLVGAGIGMTVFALVINGERGQTYRLFAVVIHGYGWCPSSGSSRAAPWWHTSRTSWRVDTHGRAVRRTEGPVGDRKSPPLINFESGAGWNHSGKRRCSTKAESAVGFLCRVPDKESPALTGGASCGSVTRTEVSVRHHNGSAGLGFRPPQTLRGLRFNAGLRLPRAWLPSVA
jgi:hypothetical protein